MSGGLGLAHLLSSQPVHEPEVLGHEHHENGAHAVEREALGCFVTNNIRNTLGHSFGVCRGGAVFGTQTGEMRFQGISNDPCAGSMIDYHSIAAAAQVRPAPKATMTTLSPFLISPVRWASSRAIAMAAAEVLPYL